MITSFLFGFLLGACATIGVYVYLDKQEAERKKRMKHRRLRSFNRHVGRSL